MATTKTDYDASSIKALDQHTHLLKRLSLTFGPPEAPGIPYASQKSVAIREVLDNSLDEVRGGHGTHVKLSFYADGAVEVEDSGRGIPVDVGTDANGKPASGIYLALGLIQSGGKFEADSKRFSSGLNGVGASSTNHCSKRMDVTVYRNGKKYELSFKDGTPGDFDGEGPDANFTPLKDLSKVRESKDTRSAAEKKNRKTGTTVKFWLRDEVFSSSNPYDHQDIINRLKRTAFLVPDLHAEIYNELHLIDGKPQAETYHFENGVEDLIELSQPDSKLHETIHLTCEGKYVERNVAVLQKDGTVKNENLERIVPIEVAMRYGEKYDATVSTFVNTIHTKLNGVHLTAFERALLATFGERFQSMRGLLKKGEVDELLAEDFMEGLTALVSVQVSEPVFTSQSKEALSGREVQKAIQEALTTEFSAWIANSKNKAALEKIAAKVATAAKNRQKAKEQRDLNRKRNEISSSALPVKLIDCEMAGTEDAELYICEGDSAKTSLKAARDGRLHALIPIRGKIINAHKEKPQRVLANAEVQDIMKALGAGSGSTFDVDKMRYGRIFIAVDADPDGNAIATLIYALFWHLFKDVLEQNKLYKVETPLFVVSTNQGAKSQKLYARNEQERDKIVARLEGQKIRYSVTRLKGLGEVQADTLEETALNPATRIITQITMEDAESASASLDLILGQDTGPRKKWIEEAEVDEALLGE